MKGIKIAGLVVFIFLLYLVRVFGFEFEKISLVQLEYNFFQTFIFFIVILGIVKFNSLINKIENNRIKNLIIKFIFVTGIFILIKYINQGFIILFDSSVIHYPYLLNLILPISYLIHELLKVIDEISTNSE